MKMQSLLDRRRFLAWMSASVAWMAAGPGPSSSKEKEKGGPRILGLELLTSAPLATMKDFYHRSLGLRIVNEQKSRIITFAAGATPLTFVETEKDDGQPFYHFAFNIPENKVLGARKWQKERTPLMPIPERLRDEQYPDLIHFRYWNAHSIFFLDPAGNVVEYIARHDLKNAAPGDFSTKDILYASEIALVVDDVAGTASKLKEIAGVDQYNGGDDQFIALGDERGLLLVMKRGRTLNFNPVDDTKAARVFRTTARVRGEKPSRYPFPGFPYELSVEG